MSFSNASKEVRRPAAYAPAHRSGPRRSCTSRSDRTWRSFTNLRTTVAPVRSLTASRAPRIRAAHASSPLSIRSGDKRDQRVCERVLVLEIPDVCEALTHQRDRLIGVPALHRYDCANIQRPGQKPRTGLSKQWHGLIEQAFRLVGVAGRKSYRGHPAQRIPTAPRDRQRPEPFNSASKPIAGRLQIATRVFDARGQNPQPTRRNPCCRGRARRPGRARCVLARVLLACTTAQPLPRVLSTRQRAEERASSESLDTTGGLRRRILESAKSHFSPHAISDASAGRRRSMSHLSAPR